MIRTKKSRWITAALAAAALIIGLLYAMGGEHSWRLRLVKVKALGPSGYWLDKVSWKELLRIVRPGSGFSVELDWHEFPVHNPFGSATDLEKAQALFRLHCASCHGADARGTGAAPALAGGQLNRAYAEVPTYRIISRGIPGTSMPRHDLPWADTWRLAAYVQSIKAHDTPLESRLSIAVNVSAAELADARNRPEDWLMYSGAYDGRRYSTQRQINRANVSRLQVRWIHQLDGEFTRQQTVPLVYKGVMFFTAQPARLFAVDAASGKVLWRYEHRVPDKVATCCGIINRGAALLGSRVFFATIDAHLIALDAGTGKVAWEREIADHQLNFSITGAPLAVNDVIVTGVSGADFGVPGFLAAFRATDGEPVWRFDAVPGPGKPGHETWQGDSWKNGGASTWMTGSFDPKTNTIYWGIGNPSPNYFGENRKGDNLYSNSVVALDAANGELRWHFQFTPHDTHDWDSAQVPVLIDGPTAAQPKQLAWPNRNGFFYSIDAQSGRFLRGKPFVQQTWAEGLDARGRPILKANTEPSEEGTTVRPSYTGGTNWWPPAYDPGSNLIFVPALERAAIYFKDQSAARITPGQERPGGSTVLAKPYYTAIRALDANTGELAWERRGADDVDESGGLLVTAGGLLFGSSGSSLLAMDARTGDLLWSFDTGAKYVAPPMTYSIDGKQFVAVAAGKLVLTFSLPPDAKQ